MLSLLKQSGSSLINLPIAKKGGYPKARHLAGFIVETQHKLIRHHQVNLYLVRSDHCPAGVRYYYLLLFYFLAELFVATATGFADSTHCSLQ